MRLLPPRIVFEPRDLWIGVYWKRETDTSDYRDRFWGNVPGVVRPLDWVNDSLVKHESLTIYVCLVPMLPIIWTLYWRVVEPNVRLKFTTNTPKPPWLRDAGEKGE